MEKDHIRSCKEAVLAKGSCTKCCKQAVSHSSHKLKNFLVVEGLSVSPWHLVSYMLYYNSTFML